MSIKIYKIDNKYSFVSNSFDSRTKYFLIPGIRSAYSYAWQAEKDARLLLKKHKYLTAEDADANESVSFEDASAESMMFAHYDGTLKKIKEKAGGVDKGDEDARQAVYEEIKLIVTGLLTIKGEIDEEKDKQKIDSIIGKFSTITKEHFNDLLSKDSKEADAAQSPEMPPMPEPMPEMSPPPAMPAAASSKRIIEAALNGDAIHLGANEFSELMEEYACSACSAIQDRMPDAVYVLYPEYRSIDIVSSSSNKRYLRLSVDKNCLMDGIMPYPDLPKFSSLDFYQLYLKPIFSSVGHLLMPDKKFLIVSSKSVLPDVTNNKTIESSVEGWNIELKQPSSMGIKFLDSPRCWKTAQAVAKSPNSSRYTEQDYAGANGPAIVQCIDAELESIVNKKGVVVQVIPYGDHVEVDVDFGNHIVRLTEEQIEIVHEV